MSPPPGFDTLTPLYHRPSPSPLQSWVEHASHAADAPIALVSIVLDHTQQFPAHVGLPPGLQVSRATSCCDSFCQFVVKDTAPLIITDALLDYSLPHNLIDRLGIRAYVGLPLRVRGITVGTLCVLDTQRRDWNASLVDVLSPIADAIMRCLGDLPDMSGGDPTRRRAQDVEPVLRLMAAESSGTLAAADIDLALSVLHQPLEVLRHLAGHGGLHGHLRERFGDGLDHWLARLALRMSWSEA